MPGHIPAWGFDSKSGGRSVYVRVFVADGRLYEVAAIVPTAGAGADLLAATRFVDSFELLI